MRYSPPLDGIRAIAVLAILIFHIAPSALRGGFTGVDVFFVLSGFLITSILLHDFRESRFSLREFYLRRIQRLIPNLMVMVLAVLVLWTVFMPPWADRQAAQHGLWTVFEASNFYIWKYLGEYWGTAAEWSPLTHTWSLGVEEQFYLLFPCFLMFLVKRQSQRIKPWLILSAIASFGLCLIVKQSHPSAAFYLLPTRVWELMIGAVLAAQRTPLARSENSPPDKNRTSIENWIAFAGLAVIVLGFFLIHDDSGFPGLVSLAPTFGAGLLIWNVVDGNNRIARLLSSRPLVETGNVSYSIYLWHWPLITLGKALAVLYGRPEIFGAIAGGVAGVVIGWIAWKAIEQPLRRRGPGRPMRFAIIAVAFSAAAIFSAVVMLRRPAPDSDHRFDTIAYYGEQYTAGEAADASTAHQSETYHDVYFPPLVPNRPNDLWRSGGVIHLYGHSTPQVVVLGSSHALMYSKTVDEICREMGLSVAFLGVDATPVYFETTVNSNFASQQEAREFDRARQRWLHEWHPDMVFLMDRWDSVTSIQGFDEKLHSLLATISPDAGQVVFVSQVPVINDGDEYNLRELVTWQARKRNALPLLFPDPNEPIRKQEVLEAVAETAEFPNLRVLRADQLFYNEDGSIQYTSGRNFYYANADHLSQSGAEVLHGMFQTAIATAMQGQGNPQAEGRSSRMAVRSRSSSHEF